MEMMTVPLMTRSFRREQMYSPIPILPGKETPTNKYRKIYEAYLKRSRTTTTAAAAARKKTMTRTAQRRLTANRVDKKDIDKAKKMKKD